MKQQPAILEQSNFLTTERLQAIAAREDAIDDWRAFFRTAIDEVKGLPFMGREVQGSLQPIISEVLQDISDDIKTIHPRLIPACFFPAGYKTPEAVDINAKVFNSRRRKRHLQRLEEEFIPYKADLIRSRIKPLFTDLCGDKVEPGTLDSPTYLRMQHLQSCTATSYLMIMNDVTGENMESLALRQAALEKFGITLLEDEEYIKIMQSNTFRNRFGVEVAAIGFTGFRLATIGALARKFRNDRTSRRVYCTISMLSNTSDNTREAGIWHSSVLLSADAETVTVHEPFSDERGRERTMSKQQFIDHWGQAYMRGYLLVADPSNS